MLRNLFKKKRDCSARMSLKNHIIVAGGGRVGEEIARILFERKEKFIIIETDSYKVDELKKKKYLVLEGNATEEKSLLEAGIRVAKKIIITLPKTKANLGIILDVKELNPSIIISARAEHSKDISKLKEAGAKNVVVPEVVAGESLA